MTLSSLSIFIAMRPETRERIAYPRIFVKRHPLVTTRRRTPLIRLKVDL
jgi:hypothetical protein